MTQLHLTPGRIRILSGPIAFVPHILADQRNDGTWAARIEFRPEAGGPSCSTGRETTQPNRRAVEYWAEGLEPVYFEGAFARACLPPIAE